MLSRLTWLQMLFGLRGVNRCKNDVSSNGIRMASIQPQQSAMSSASACVTVGSPEAFLWILIQISDCESWFARSHVSNAAASRKARIFFGAGLTGDMIFREESESLAFLERIGQFRR